jgi:hypothetical protein
MAAIGKIGAVLDEAAKPAAADLSPDAIEVVRAGLL